jgi:hypothetical protein
MRMTRLLTLVVLGLAVVASIGEATSKRIQVTAQVVQTAFTGDPNDLRLGAQQINNVVLLDESGTAVGTGAGVCTLVSLPPLETLLQCLSTAVFAEGQLIFGGVVPVPEVGAVAHFGILGGTGDFRTARGDVTLVVTTPELVQEATFDLEID